MKVRESIPGEDIAEKGIVVGDEGRIKCRLGIGIMLEGRCFGGHIGRDFLLRWTESFCKIAE